MNVIDKTRQQTVIEEIEFLLGTERADHIAHRLGYTDLGSLQRSLHRWGRHDLAAHFRREHWDPMYKRNQKVWW